MCYNTCVNLGNKLTERVDRESPVLQTATGVTRDSRELLCPVAAELRLEVGRRWSLTAAPRVAASSLAQRYAGSAGQVEHC